MIISGRINAYGLPELILEADEGQIIVAFKTLPDVLEWRSVYGAMWKIAKHLHDQLRITDENWQEIDDTFFMLEAQLG